MLHRPQIRARLAQVTHRTGCGKPTAGMPTDSRSSSSPGSSGTTLAVIFLSSYSVTKAWRVLFPGPLSRPWFRHSPAPSLQPVPLLPLLP